MEIIKVAIADDHKIFRKGVVLSLRPFTNIKFTLEAENGDQLLEMLPAEEFGFLFKLVPLIFVFGLFGFLKENPFKINTRLTLER